MGGIKTEKDEVEKGGPKKDPVKSNARRDTRASRKEKAVFAVAGLRVSISGIQGFSCFKKDWDTQLPLTSTRTPDSMPAQQIQFRGEKGSGPSRRSAATGIGACLKVFVSRSATAEGHEHHRAHIRTL